MIKTKTKWVPFDTYGGTRWRWQSSILMRQQIVRCHTQLKCMVTFILWIIYDWSYMVTHIWLPIYVLPYMVNHIWYKYRSDHVTHRVVSTRLPQRYKTWYLPTRVTIPTIKPISIRVSDEFLLCSHVWLSYMIHHIWITICE